MTSVTYTNSNKLLLIRDIQEIAKTYINDDRSYRWIWKNKIADIYHIGYVTFMNYISVPSINAKNDEAIAKKKLPRYFKSLVSLIVGIATIVLYLYKLDASLETVLLSFLICTFGYDLIIKPILKAIKRHFADSKSV